MKLDMMYLVGVQHTGVSDADLYCVIEEFMCKLLNFFRPSGREEKVLALSVQL